MAKAKKGQMSLEMIIGLLILLVVAVVVIRIFITSFKQDPQKTFESTIKEMNFKSDCDNICSDYKNSGTRAALAKFCYTKMIGDPDLNKNGLIDKYQSMTKVLEICEDSVYCFHVTKCETESGVIDWSDCREATCEAYREVYPDNMNKVDKKVTELFNLGSCKGIKNDEDWIKLYFNQGDDKPCSNPPTGQNCIISFDSCDINGLAFTCVSEHSEPIPTGECDPNEFILIAVGTGKDGANIIGVGYTASPKDGKGSVVFAAQGVITGTLELYICSDSAGNPITCPAGAVIDVPSDCQADVYYKLISPIESLDRNSCKVKT